MLRKPGFDVVCAAASVLEADRIASLLQQEGIPAYVEQDSRSDEFAMSQALMGLPYVLVPTVQMAQARKLIADIAEARPARSEKLPWDAPDPEAEEDD